MALLDDAIELLKQQTLASTLHLDYLHMKQNMFLCKSV